LPQRVVVARIRNMVYHRENGEWVCPPPPPDDIDYYIQKGAPHCDAPVVGAESAGYAPALGHDEEETPLKCYMLDEDRDISGSTLFINGEGKAEPLSPMLQMQNAVTHLNPDTMNPGVQPGDIETILSWLLAAVIILIILCTLAYYAWGVYKQPHGSFWNFVTNLALKWPRWWWCP